MAQEEPKFVVRGTTTTTTQSTHTSHQPIFEMDTIITAKTPIVTDPLRTGFKRIDIEAFMGKHTFTDRALAIRCMVASWASMLNLGRKGDAGKLWEIGKTSFGEKTWEDAVTECLSCAESSGKEESGQGENLPVSEKKRQRFGA